MCQDKRRQRVLTEAAAGIGENNPLLKLGSERAFFSNDTASGVKLPGCPRIPPIVPDSRASLFTNALAGMETGEGRGY
jgi:hypothetical protein